MALRRGCLREALRMGAAREAAEDAAQEALLRAWRAWSRDGLPDEPSAWLTTVTRREVARWHGGPQGRTWSQAIGAAPPDAGYEDPHDALAERLDMHRALRTLTREDRLLLHLRYEEDRTQAQVAELAGLPEGTAKVRLHRLRARLRDQLAP
jgi:RNA polymerase sigma-70 factor, ECF subfamily